MAKKKKENDINIEDLLEKETIVDSELSFEIKDSILNYAVEVITDRALPNIYDGCKPVQRRILYAGFVKKYFSNGVFIKCAKYVGDVMGDYHCHGDSSIYLALVALAQPWTNRYPLIDFHGNMGSYDGDLPASSRYTESKLNKLAELTMDGMNNNAVEMMPNYSETTVEPKLLPAVFPMLLCNGTSGIAVGYTTEIPSHNLNEVCDGIIATLKNPEITLDDLMKIIPGPDATTGSILLNNEEIKKMYQTGKGKLTYKAKYKIEDNKIIIYELPPDVNKPKLVDSLYKLCIEDRKVPRVSSVKDYSTEKTNIVIELQKTAIPEAVVKTLFDSTELTKNVSYIIRAIKDNTPYLFSLKEIIEHYIIHRRKCIKKEYQYMLDNTTKKLHLQNGYVKVTKNLKKAISIIEESENDQEAKEKLKLEFNIDEEQAEAILEFKLRRLTKLNKNELLDLVKSLEEKIKNYNDMLSNVNLVDLKIIEQLEELKKKYGDKRRTTIINRERKIKEDQEALLVLTNKNNIKVISSEAFESAWNNNSLKERTEVYIKKIQCKMNDIFIVIIDTGEFARISFQELLNWNNKNNIVGLYIQDDLDKVIVSITKKGMLSKVKLSAFKNKTQKLSPVFEIDDDDKIVNTKLIDVNEDEDINNRYIITMLTKNGLIHRFYESSTKVILSTGKKGIGTINLRENDEVVDFDISKNDVRVALYTKGEQFGIKILSVDDLLVKGRIGRGYSCIKLNNNQCYKVVCSKGPYVDVDIKGKLHLNKIDMQPIMTKASKSVPLNYEPVALNFKK